MQEKFRWWMLVAPVALVLRLSMGGCVGAGGHGSLSDVTHSVPPAEAAIQIQKVFSATADPEVSQVVQVASNDLKNKDLEGAFITLRKLMTAPNLTHEQDYAIRNALIGVQADLAAAVVNGNPRALEIAQRIGGVKH